MISLKVLLLIVLILVFIMLIIWARNSEKKLWNKGCCPECWSEWKYFDTDSQGGRGYKCPTCGKHIWISYNVDK